MLPRDLLKIASMMNVLESTSDRFIIYDIRSWYLDHRTDIHVIFSSYVSRATSFKNKKRRIYFQWIANSCHFSMIATSGMTEKM